MKRVLVVAVCVLLVSQMASAGQITIKGSDTMVRLCQRWAEDYMKNHKETVIQVSGGGSSSGIAALVNGSTKICMTSRELSAQETQMMSAKGIDLRRFAVARDGVAVYLNKENPIRDLTIEQLREIYTDSINNWNQLGGKDNPIILYGRENNSGTFTFFRDRILGGEDFAERCEPLPGTASVVHAVAHDPNGIGYGGIAWASGIKYAAISENDTAQPVTPTVENVTLGVYPIARDLCFLLNGDPSGEVRDFVNWVLSSEGQALAQKAGFVPLPVK